MSRLVINSDDELKKAKSLVTAWSEGGEFAALDRKVFNMLLSNAYGTLKTARTHRIPMSELAASLTNGRVDRVKESLERLWRYKIAMEYEDEAEKRILRAHYISYEMSNIENSILTYAFDPLLVDHIGDPKLYSLFSIDTMKKFSSETAGKLYEYCMMFANRNHPQFYMTLEEMHRFFEVDGVYVDRFDHFRTKVIDKCIEEVNRFGEVSVSVEYARAGRGNKAIGATFKTHRKSALGTAAASEAMPQRIGARRGHRDDATVDMFEMRTDAEIRARPQFRQNTLDRAKMIIGSEGILDTYMEEWIASRSNRGFGMNPDEDFLAWLEVKLAKDTKESMQDIDVDAIYERLMQGD